MTEDEVMELEASTQIAAEETYTLQFPASVESTHVEVAGEGDTWRIEIT